ncbi:protein arginine methyltransferase NDUFAF7, mitochondrial isoform X3 [Electrophorus electricus]|uniref:protein arginine methyltransferase NDUFAF7, mitochondrial isoform X3 n=1 Tax=Electrophorus electricus TaxID=8005 RepID=UPI0015CFC30B|nr:protein arginine methyltransferase NDUFAF7, mitochondrial isoform X3 [Electrophorus electricus]
MWTFLKIIRLNRATVRSLNPLPRGWTVVLRRSCSSASSESRVTNPSILRHLTSKITATGAITVAEYMREVLTNPVSGYYVKNDMLGADGDFITSPEISQIFGELVGIWCVSEWVASGKPKVLQLVELGPGRGSLIGDILRVFHQLQSVLHGAEVSVHLVEVSPKLSQLQAQCLAGEYTCGGEDELVYRTGTTHTGLPIYWYRSVKDVPRGFSIFLAHEFFDALPIHKFQEDEKRQHLEISPEGGVIVQKLASQIAEDGGAALIADYGHDGTKMDTFRGFRGHKLHDVLEAPGTADLTADVDFSYLRRMAGDAVVCMGPITQRAFLKNMGIDARLQVLLRSCHDATTRAQLIHGCDMLTSPEKMGSRFQFFSLLAPSRLTQPWEEGEGLGRRRRGPAPLPVAGFSELGL